ncbi:MAG: hypothetical protein AB7P69_08120 [Candidatus Binatia bacterium]
MIAFIPPVSGASANTLDMIDAIVPFTGTVLVGLFLSSLAGIVITVLADRWLTRRQQRVLTAEVVNVNPIRRAA